MLAKKEEAFAFWQVVFCSISRRYEITAQIPNGQDFNYCLKDLKEFERGNHDAVGFTAMLKGMSV